MSVWRRPSLPQGSPCSTIGVGRLNFRVRNGTGCFPLTMATTTIHRNPPPAGRHGVPKLVWNRPPHAQGPHSIITPRGCHSITTPWGGWLHHHGLSPPPRGAGGQLVGWEPHSGREHQNVAEKNVRQALGHLVPVSSTCHHASTSGPSTRWSTGGLTRLFCGNPHLEACFPLRCFQRLSLPNVANQPCSWWNNWHTRGWSVPVLSY